MAQVKTVVVEGESGRVVVNESDQTEWEAKGYTVVDESAPADPPAAPASDTNDPLADQD